MVHLLRYSPLEPWFDTWQPGEQYFGGLQFKAANTSKIDEWWAPKGKIPYLVIQGSNDQAAPSENGELLKKDLGDRVTLVTLKDAGHLVSVTRPQEVSDAMVKFLKKLPR